jgi:hypothetical protein
MAEELAWPRFPCGTDKAPLTGPGGFKNARLDYDVKDAPMVGLAIPDGYAVIDIDPRHNGWDTIRDLKTRGHNFPVTRRVATGGGGKHLYFKVPADVNLRSSLGEGVDVKRAGKGYVISPPSPGYVLEADVPIAEAPSWLIDTLRRPDLKAVESEAHAPKYMPFESGTEYGLVALDGECERLREAKPGERNDTLNRAAFALGQLAAGGELDEEVARAALIETAFDLGWDRVEDTVESGFTAGLDEPRQAPSFEASSPGDADPVIGSVLAGTGEDLPMDDHYWMNWDVEEPEPPFLLHPILPKNSYVLVYGATEASKSMVFVGLAAEASHRGIKCSIYSLENPPAIDRDRLRRLRPLKSHFRLTNEPLDVSDPDQLKHLVAREADWGTDILIIDTYSHAYSSRSEDGNRRAIEFARRMRYLMHECDCTVIVIDHTGYAHNEPRDASAKRQQVDVAILMEKAGEWRKGQPARFTMTNNKAARFGNPFRLTGEIRDGKNRELEIHQTSGEKWEWR